MIKTVLYYALSTLFTLLLVALYKLFIVFIIGAHDPKFGELGTVSIAMYISGACALVSFLSSSTWFYKGCIKEPKPKNLEIIFQSLLNALVLSALYMPLIRHLPIIDGVRDWPQYIIYFLFFGIVVAVFTSYINSLINWPNISSKKDALKRASS
jgi:hypothetical protein